MWPSSLFGCFLIKLQDITLENSLFSKLFVIVSLCLVMYGKTSLLFDFHLLVVIISINLIYGHHPFSCLAHHNNDPAMVSKETKVLFSFLAQYPGHMLTVFSLSFISNWCGSVLSDAMKSHNTGNCFVLMIL